MAHGLWLTAILGIACTDYDLQGGKTHEGRVDDTDEHDPDTSSQEDTNPAETGDSAGEETPGEVPDGKVDVVLLIDIAYWYDCYHADLPVVTNDLVNALFGSGADVAVAIATYDDYNVEGEWYNAFSGVPYLLVQQLTTDIPRLQSSTSGLELEWGGDGPGTGFEAVVQAATGLGYDQDCSGRFESNDDIRAFNATSGDAFGGRENGSASASVPGTGPNPGVGFRQDSKRVVLVFAENVIRDRDLGHGMPPNACPGAASSLDAAQAIRAADAKVLGVNVYEFQADDPQLQNQLLDFASATDSRIDADGDGAKDDPAVLSGSWDWPPTTTLVDAIWDLAGA